MINRYTKIHNRNNIKKVSLVVITFIIFIFSICNFSYAKSININGVDITIDSETIKKKVAKEIEKETFSSKEESKDEEIEDKQDNNKDVKDTSVKVDISITNHNPYESATVTIEEKVNVGFRRSGSKKETYTIEKGKNKDIEYKYTYNKSYVRDQIDKWFNKDYEELEGRDSDSYFYEEANERDNIEDIKSKNTLETDDKKLEKKASKIGIIILVIFIIVFLFIIYLMVMTKIRDKDIDIEKYLRESRKDNYKSRISSICMFISLSLIFSIIVGSICSNIVYASDNIVPIYKKGEKTKKVIKEVIDFNNRYYDFIYEITIEYSNNYKVSDEDYEIDTDGDGLTDALEYKYMTDKNNVDSDGDGLSDYLEVVLFNYNPNSVMTYEDYINDSYRDYDGDGLSNIEELQEHNTNPTTIDTDFDGLTDYDEIFIYNTDPLDEDSDGDTLKDGVEIKLGLNPNNMMTDGSTLDSERKIEQNYDVLELPNNLTSGDIRVSRIEGEISGDISEKILISEYKDVNVENSSALVLKPFKIETKDGDNINFTFDVSKVSERQDKLCIVKYENGTLKAVSTRYSDNAISGNLSDGIYGIADAEYILRGLNINVNNFIH